MKINTLLLNAASAANASGVKDCRQTAPKNHTFYLTPSAGAVTGVVRIYALSKSTNAVASGQQLGGDWDLATLTPGQTYTLEFPDRAFNAVAALISTVIGGGTVSVRYAAN